MLDLQGRCSRQYPRDSWSVEKNCCKLLKEFGSVEELLLNAEKVTGKIKDKIIANKDLAILSKKLATIGQCSYTI